MFQNKEIKPFLLLGCLGCFKHLPAIQTISASLWCAPYWFWQNISGGIPQSNIDWELFQAAWRYCGCVFEFLPHNSEFIEYARNTFWQIHRRYITNITDITMLLAFSLNLGYNELLMKWQFRNVRDKGSHQIVRGPTSLKASVELSFQ